MTAFALRLTLRGGRQSAARFAFVTAGVAVGVVMLLFATASINGLHAQDARFGWLSTSAHNHRPSGNGATADPMWWRRTQDHFHNQTIERIDLAATGPRAPVPPGVPALPGPGQFYASPALTRLLTNTPADELADRYPGRQIGIIGRAALTSPNVLIVVIGHDTHQLAGQPGAVLVRSIETASRQHSYSTFQAVALGIGAAGLLFPVLIFVGMATRIDATRREQRLAAMRLVGATPRQVAVLAAVEAAIAALAGALAGFAVFLLSRPLLARIPLTGDSWFTRDLSVGPLAVTLVCIAVPAGAAIAAVSALRRVSVSPLGVSRRVTPPEPNTTRLAPLGLGVLILAVFALAGHPYDRGASGSYAPTIVFGFVLMMAGIVTAGPWLTMTCTRALARRSRRPASLIASRRLADNPSAAFRAVSGLILAVFVGSVLVGFATTATQTGGLDSGTGTSADSTALTRAGSDSSASTRPVDAGPNATLSADKATQIAAELRIQPGVHGVTNIYRDATDTVNGYPTGFVACADVTHTPAIGHCATNAKVAVMPLYGLDIGHTQPQARWPAARTSLAQLNTLPVQAILVATDGTDSALERVRTTVERNAPTELGVPTTLRQLSDANLRDVTQIRHMANIAILISVLIAGCSLAVAIAGGVIERKRPFSLLRLTGMPLRTLRHVVILEAAVPLISMTIVSAGAGLLTATLLLRAVNGTTLHLPGPEYYLTILAGLIVALAVVTSTLPLLKRVSDPENARSA